VRDQATKVQQETEGVIITIIAVLTDGGGGDGGCGSGYGGGCGGGGGGECAGGGGYNGSGGYGSDVCVGGNGDGGGGGGGGDGGSGGGECGGGGGYGGCCGGGGGDRYAGGEQNHKRCISVLDTASYRLAINKKKLTKKFKPARKATRCTETKPVRKQNDTAHDGNGPDKQPLHYMLTLQGHLMSASEIRLFQISTYLV